MELLEFRGSSVNARFIDKATEALREGKIIVYPTDTLYALGCDALNARAIEALCRIKDINPEKQLLSIVCHDLSQAAEYARIDNRAFRLLRSNLPGPFTFILPAATTLPKVFKGRKQVGVRIPACDVARALAEALGHPILSASVEPAQDCDEVLPEQLALDYAATAEYVLSEGPGGIVASAVVDVTDSANPEILREGPADLN